MQNANIYTLGKRTDPASCTHDNMYNTLHVGQSTNPKSSLELTFVFRPRLCVAPFPPLSMFTEMFRPNLHLFRLRLHPLFPENFLSHFLQVLSHLFFSLPPSLLPFFSFSQLFLLSLFHPLPLLLDLPTPPPRPPPPQKRFKPIWLCVWINSSSLMIK